MKGRIEKAGYDATSKHARSLLLYYDEYHTPLRELTAVLGNLKVLQVFIGDGRVAGLSDLNRVDTIRIDGRARFCAEVLQKAIKANALYQDGYHLISALAMPLLAQVSVEQARKFKISRIFHGMCGNDGARFMAAVNTIAPKMAVDQVTSVIGSRTIANRHEHTVSQNIWGTCVESGELENPAAKPLPGTLSRYFGSGKLSSDSLRIGFARGVPSSIDGRRLSLVKIIEQLNERGSKAGCGFCDMVEDGAVGLKTRALYASPAAAILRVAHLELERAVSTNAQNRFKRKVDDEWSQLIYSGKWFDPARMALDEYIDYQNSWVSGTVDLEIGGGGGIRVRSRRSSHALFENKLAIYKIGQDFGVNLLKEMSWLDAQPARKAMARRMKSLKN